MTSYLITAEIVVTGEELQISGGSLPYTYQLDEYHFHWGADSTVGSEHAVDGSHYPLEVRCTTGSALGTCGVRGV